MTVSADQPENTMALSGASRLAKACSGRPFSNGTEGDAWMYRWCEFCEHDHEIHTANGGGPGCPIIGDQMMGSDAKWPEAWLPEPDDGSFYLPSRLVCLAFKACHKDGCDGDPGAEARANRIDEVTAYWQSVCGPSASTSNGAIGPDTPPTDGPARTVEVSDRTDRTDPDLP